MAEKRLKALAYRRAEWLDTIPKGMSLESYVHEALTRLKTVESRTVQRAEGQCLRCLKKYEPRSGGIFLHISADTPGEKASVVPKAIRSEELDVSTADAPANAEFMDGDAFVLISGNDVFICSTGLRDAAVRSYLYGFFRAAKLDEVSSHFDLMKVANVNKIRMLRQQGVKQIDLRVSLFQATVQYEKRKANTTRILGLIGKQLSAVGGQDNSEEDDGLRVQVTIKTDERVMKKGLAIGEKKIEKLAIDVIESADEDVDEYLIETKTGQKIGSSEIVIREAAWIDVLGKSVKRDQAWAELEAFYKASKKSGLLEQ